MQGVIEKEKKQNFKKQEKKTNTRNYYIDVLKGIAIIWVVFIHTTFHSGTAYIPSWFANFTLIFEVPMFFFLAGWSYSYSKGNKSYLQGMIITQIKYMIFMTIIFGIINITNQLKISNNPVTIENLINWFFHTYSPTNPMQSVKYSLWFFRVYFFVSLLGAEIISFVKPNIRKYIIGICFLGIFIITFFAPNIGKINLGIQISYIIFYLFFYMLGYDTKDKKLSLILLIVLIAITALGLIAINNLTDIDVTQIQAHKFLPNFIFMLWSLFGVYIVIFLKRYFNSCKKNVLSVIGSHSIYIYFAQGIGASSLYYISKHITMDWYYKVWIMFGINILVTVVVTLLLKIILDPIGKWIKKILNEKVCK